MLAFSNDYYGMIFRATQSVELFCAYYAGVSVPSGTAWKSKLMRYAKERPDEVKLMVENADGSAFFHVPVNYIKCSPPRQISEGQKEAARQRFQEMREKKKMEEMEDECRK